MSSSTVNSEPVRTAPATYSCTSGIYSEVQPSAEKRQKFTSELFDEGGSEEIYADALPVEEEVVMRDNELYDTT